MKNTISLRNGEIFSVAIILKEFCENPELVLPIKANFYLQRNKTVLLELAQEIEAARNEIFAKYGTLNEQGTGYNFEEAVIADANAELEELLMLSQDVGLYMINIDDFKDIKLNNQEMGALMLMIEEIE
jgi:hypothetical protein